MKPENGHAGPPTKVFLKTVRCSGGTGTGAKEVFRKEGISLYENSVSTTSYGADANSALDKLRNILNKTTYDTCRLDHNHCVSCTAHLYRFLLFKKEQKYWGLFCCRAFYAKMDCRHRCHRHFSARFLLLSAPILRVGEVKKVIKNLVFLKKCTILHSKIIIN